MAVEDKYVDANVEAGKKGSALTTHGSHEFVAVTTEEIEAADSDGSVYRLFPAVNDTLVPTEITILHDTITGGTDYDLGLYEVNGGPVVNVNLLMNNQDLTSGSSKDGLGNINIVNRVKTLYELAGKDETNRVGAYDICLTAQTVGTASGTITAIARFAQK